LRAFEAYARHGNLAEAADELLVTGSAVSHQIKALETFLGAKLFVRRAHGMEMTPHARTFLENTRKALDLIEVETRRMSAQNDDQNVVINVYQTLAQCWLVPRLPDFFDTHPDISVSVISTPDELDLNSSEIDLAIRHFERKPAGFHVSTLFTEYLRPVASPGYLQRYPPINSAADLAGQSLIDCTWLQSEWDDWFEPLGLSAHLTAHRFQCDTRSQALTAATHGIGVALDRFPNGQGLIDTGQLVPVGTDCRPTGGAYYLIAPERSMILPHVKTFCKWLERTAGELPSLNDTQ
jgi:LysR family glycine cleavage system transcriptional activator